MKSFLVLCLTFLSFQTLLAQRNKIRTPNEPSSKKDIPSLNSLPSQEVPKEFSQGKLVPNTKENQAHLKPNFLSKDKGNSFEVFETNKENNPNFDKALKSYFRSKIEFDIRTK